MGFGLVLPLLPYIAERFNANPVQIGLLAATYSFFQFIATPILGRLSDRYGRKKLLIISQLGTFAGFILLGLANTLPLLFLARLIDGITGGNISIAQAYIADVTDQKNRAKGMGTLGAAFGLGFILGPVIGGMLSAYGFWLPAFFAALMSLITVFTTYKFLPESVDVSSAARSPKAQLSVGELFATITHPALAIFIMTFLLMSLAFSGMQGTFALWAQQTFHWDARGVSYIFAYIGILAVIMQLKVLPFVVKKLGERRTLIISIPLLAAGLLLIPLGQNVPFLIVAITLMIFGNSMANPTLQALASENVDKNEYGGTLGLLQSAGSVGRVLGPIIGGELFYHFSKNTPYYMSAVILFITSLIVYKFLPAKTKTPVATTV